MMQTLQILPNPIAERSRQENLYKLFVPSNLDDYGLDPFEFRIYARIVRRGRAYESIPRMAKTCKMSEDKVRDALRALCAFGLLEKDDSQGAGYSLIYRPTDNSSWCHPEQVEELRPCPKSTIRRRSTTGSAATSRLGNTRGVVADSPGGVVVDPPGGVVVDPPNKGNPYKEFPFRQSQQVLSPLPLSQAKPLAQTELQKERLESNDQEPPSASRTPSRLQTPVAASQDVVQAYYQQAQAVGAPALLALQQERAQAAVQRRIAPGLLDGPWVDAAQFQALNQWLRGHYPDKGEGYLAKVVQSIALDPNHRDWLSFKAGQPATQPSEPNSAAQVSSASPNYDWTADPRFEQWLAEFRQLQYQPFVHDPSQPNAINQERARFARFVNKRGLL
ncbi:hypothetical protein [Leptolyngbya sp. FACHB-261]|uniref:hypothetical protein n=1 Tax=Leptolyngbya sp. FACHB-261 TaxID=2692806 RepID=UPI001684313E|nr:hypothetical protein [Leptolyngbya sp. FACHB-261]MBD2105176.1 hypothetical protein [Leptolyngbya sp. FACHB-261]